MKKYTAGFLFVDGKILLGLRSRTRAFFPGVWDFIGGHCQPSESYEQAMKREFREETGVDVLEAQLVVAVETPDVHFHIFRITEWLGTPRNQQPEEHEALGWFRFEELSALRFPQPEYKAIFEALARKGLF